MDKILSVIDEKQALLDQTADFLWDHPETAFTEFQSAAYLCKVLREEGFAVEENLTSIATAFKGTFGSGKPVIGFLGEFDALNGLSQVACASQPCSAGGDAGHGCSHNLLGTGALGAAIAVKEWLKATGKSGTVIYFGCPGEEGGAGKGFMARDGAFDGLDVAFTWHPDRENNINPYLFPSNYHVLYQFHGVAAHAAGQPHEGRSALDAVELMNMGVQFLREHIPATCRIHYAITNSGGLSPNVVQPYAEVNYSIRAVDNKTVAEVYERVNDVARGAAIMTGTTENHQFLSAYSSVITNSTLLHMLYEKLQAVPVPQPTEQELAEARIFAKEALGRSEEECEQPYRTDISPFRPETQGYASTDAGDVSWICPTAQIYTACVPVGTPGHSWQQVSMSKSSYAKKMTGYAAKILAAGAVEILTNPELLEKAWQEHRQKVGPEGYQPPIPKDIHPVAVYATKKD